GAVCGAWQGVGAIDQAMLDEIERVNGLDLETIARDLAAVSEGMR
ncbi:MAG: ADP-ribosylglycohydrolase family protein, partial [Ardenticatenales bacterium]|nr:ADP-ribosylglycohydrolase family protein [Ardenticatenales bacterium]